MRNEENLNETNHLLALNAAFQLHNELLYDDAFLGYDGTLDQFQLLCAECLFIVENELRVVGITQWVVEKFYENQLEIVNGNREPGYYEA
jgi:hypothetical protein